jgi:hypothetical protein
MNENEINSYFSYELTNKDIAFLKEIINELLKNIPADAFNCALSSAMLSAMISDHSNIPVSVISGHLDYYKKRIFNCYKPIPYSNDEEIIDESWDGHCWVEINNLIIDTSIFRTIYNGDVSNDLYSKIVNQFGKGRGALLGSPKEIQELGFDYIPCYCLNN